jgi:phage head maturation protease
MEEVQMGDTQTASPNLEYKAVAVNGFKVDDPDNGVVTAIVAVTGIKDNVKDIIHPGSFEKSLATRTPKGVWHHNWHESVSRTEAIKELWPGDPDLPDRLPNGDPWPKEAGGLQVKTKFNLDTQRGREAYSDVVFFGDDQEWSIGYNVPTGGATRDSKTGIRNIKAMELYEYSPVLFGAMPVARTSSVKDAQMAYKQLVVDGSASIELENKEEPLPEEEGREEEPEVEAKLFSPPTERMKMTPAQASKLYKVMNQIMDLLRDAEVLVESDDPVNAANDSAVEEESNDGGGGTFVDMVTDAFDGDEDLIIAAEDFDASYDAEDREGMESAADPIVSAVEQAVEDGEDEADYSDITDYIVSAFEDVGGAEEEEEPEEEEPEVEAPVTEVKPTSAVATKVLNLDELAGILD